MFWFGLFSLIQSEMFYFRCSVCFGLCCSLWFSLRCIISDVRCVLVWVVLFDSVWVLFDLVWDVLFLMLGVFWFVLFSLIQSEMFYFRCSVCFGLGCPLWFSLRRLFNSLTCVTPFSFVFWIITKHKLGLVCHCFYQ